MSVLVVTSEGQLRRPLLPDSRQERPLECLSPQAAPSNIAKPLPSGLFPAARGVRHLPRGWRHLGPHTLAQSSMVTVPLTGVTTSQFAMALEGDLLGTP